MTLGRAAANTLIWVFKVTRVRVIKVVRMIRVVRFSSDLDEVLRVGFCERHLIREIRNSKVIRVVKVIREVRCD